MHDKTIPFSLALEQRRNLAALAQTSVASAIQIARRKPADNRDVWINDEIEAPRTVLVDNYQSWVGMPASQRVSPASYRRTCFPSGAYRWRCGC
ncbi:MAG: hypothetical protein R3F38_08640 [Gammaproteobacteria bacterium]